jgi:glycosyltransferase involved in cell wall biosynthesis
MAALDVLVLPASYKSFGLVLIEAMAAGKPVVATATGGVPGIVRDGETGILVPPLAPGALAAAVVRILGDPGGARGWVSCDAGSSSRSPPRRRWKK